MNSFAARADNFAPARDRRRDASRWGAALSFAFYLGLGLYLCCNPKIFAAHVGPTEPEPILIEMVSFAEPESKAAPIPEELPEPEPPPATEPAPEPDPIPVPAPQPKPKPKKETRPKPTQAPERKEAPAKSAPAPAPAAPSREAQDKFASDFVKAVEKNKFYPKEARKAGLTGTVKVKVTFDGQGFIRSASLLPGSYPAELGEAAMATIEKVKKRWAPKNGGPSSLTVPIGFRLR
ncbi:hypothetical protein C4J81_01905 [Deltaproteobacteria bacterium Smac51]|nr:hypothetical protein C4J81_01905 [Deltaproteobacteria bacterium Smac51]